MSGKLFLLAVISSSLFCATRAQTNCKQVSLDFIVREGDPKALAVEQDIVADLAKIGIQVNTVVLDSEAYAAAELGGQYHMLFSRTWGAPYDPHSYLNSWDVPAHVEYSALTGISNETREDIFQRIENVQKQTDETEISTQWKGILQDIHSLAIFLPLWGSRTPYVINRRFTAFTPSSNTYSYPLNTVRILSGSPNVTVAPGVGGSLFTSVGPVHPHQYSPNSLFAQAWVYEGLTAYGQDGQIGPALASSWEIEDSANGGSVYTFTLREGVKFHDGSDWNCSVAKLNFDHVLSDTVKQRHAWFGTSSQLTSWTCNAAGQFVLETKDKFYPLLQELSYIRPLTFAAASAFSQGLDSDADLHNSCNTGDFGERWDFLEENVTCAGLQPIGTGPFKVASIQLDEASGIDTEAIFARHDDYWGTVPDIEYLHVKYYENTDDVQADLLSGDLDMALGNGPLTPEQIQQLKTENSATVEVLHSDVLQNAFVVMNTKAEGTNDIQTRKAIIHAINKAQIVEKEFFGLERPVDQLLPRSAPYCDVDLYPSWSYDPEKAELLNCQATTMDAPDSVKESDSQSSDEDKLSSGEVAGIVIGVIAALLVGGLIGFFCAKCFSSSPKKVTGGSSVAGSELEEAKSERV